MACTCPNTSGNLYDCSFNDIMIPELGIPSHCIEIEHKRGLFGTSIIEDRRLLLGRSDILQICELFECPPIGILFHLEELEITHPIAKRKMIIRNGGMDNMKQFAIFDLNWKDK